MQIMPVYKKKKKSDIALFPCQAGLKAFCGLSAKSQQVNYKHLRK